MYGWRARIALITAHSNAVIEPEVMRLCPDGVSVHTARVRLGGISVEGSNIPDAALREAVLSLCDINAKALAWTCTAANVGAGADGDLKQARFINSISGIPTIPASAAIIEALAALGARKIVLATQYQADLNESSAVFWKASGIEVIKISSIDLGGARKPMEPLSSKPVSHVGLQHPTFAYNLARYAYDKNADAVVVCGAGLRTIEAAAPFEKDFGVPFLSSTIATFWACLQAAGIRESVPGYGRLLEEQPALQWVRIPKV